MATAKKITRAGVRIGGHEVGRVLITGASAGIGEQLARAFARRGHRLTLVARSKDKLGALAAELKSEFGVDVQVVVQDLAKPAGAAAVVRAATAGSETVDVLVNNAGVIDVGAFAAASTDKLVGLVDLNVRALTELTHRLLPGMIERKFGRVLNVASLAAFQAVPSMAAYAASKAYVLALTEALSVELRGSGVKVTALCPGMTDTAMVADIKGGMAAAARLPAGLVSRPEDVAEQAYKALMAGRTVVVPGLPNQISAAWVQATPRWLVRHVSGFAARGADWLQAR